MELSCQVLHAHCQIIDFLFFSVFLFVYDVRKKSLNDESLDLTMFFQYQKSIGDLALKEAKEMESEQKIVKLTVQCAMVILNLYIYFR